MMPMDASTKGWLIKTARKHYWRIAHWMELDDLIQDGYLHYQRISIKYSHIKDPPHLMRLFQVTYINHLHDLSKKRTRQLERPLSDCVCEDQTEQSLLDRLGSEGTELTAFGLLLRAAPKPVQDVLALLTTEKGRRALRSRTRVRVRGRKETLNEKLCRLCGYDPRIMDLEGLVRQYLRSGPEFQRMIAAPINQS